MTNQSSDNANQGASYSQCAYNMTTTLAAIAGPALIAYFAAPYLALATRAIFPAAYALVIGPPSTIGYYSTYIPAREYACTMVYNNSHIIVGTASATVQAAKKIVTYENAVSVGLGLGSLGGGFILHTAASKLTPENKTTASPIIVMKR